MLHRGLVLCGVVGKKMRLPAAGGRRDFAEKGQELLPLVYAELRGSSKHRRIHDGEHVLQQVLRSALDELHFARAIIE